MRTGVTLSLAGHGLLLGAALVTWPFAEDSAPSAPPAVSVSLVRPEDVPRPGVSTPSTPTPAPDAAAPPPPAPDRAPEAPASAPPPVDRVAPVPQPAPPETAQEGDTIREALRADPAADAPVRDDDPQEATAPEAAAPEIVTEATETAEDMPPGPPRPELRPTARPVLPDTEVAADTPTPEPAETPTRDPVERALEEALRAPDPAPAAPQAAGPPLTAGERDGLRLSVSRCWNFSALSTAAAQVTVTVGMDMARDGTPANLRMIGHEGGGAAAARQAYETARRAILRCQPYALPAEKYAQWQEIEMTFNPDEMRRR
mgnify:CR=1 FL=1